MGDSPEFQLRGVCSILLLKPVAFRASRVCAVIHPQEFVLLLEQEYYHYCHYYHYYHVYYHYYYYYYYYNCYY